MGFDGEPGSFGRSSTSTRTKQVQPKSTPKNCATQLDWRHPHGRKTVGVIFAFRVRSLRPPQLSRGGRKVVVSAGVPAAASFRVSFLIRTQFIWLLVLALPQPAGRRAAKHRRVRAGRGQQRAAPQERALFANAQGARDGVACGQQAHGATVTVTLPR